MFRGPCVRSLSFPAGTCLLDSAPERAREKTSPPATTELLRPGGGRGFHAEPSSEKSRLSGAMEGFGRVRRCPQWRTSDLDVEAASAAPAAAAVGAVAELARIGAAATLARIAAITASERDIPRGRALNEAAPCGGRGSSAMKVVIVGTESRRWIGGGKDGVRVRVKELRAGGLRETGGVERRRAAAD